MSIHVYIIFICIHIYIYIYIHTYTPGGAGRARGRGAGARSCRGADACRRRGDRGARAGGALQPGRCHYHIVLSALSLLFIICCYA